MINRYRRFSRLQLSDCVALFLTTALIAIGLWTEAARAEGGASRIVSLGSSVTEIIYALGEQDRIVARDSTSTYPPDVLAVPDVGYLRALFRRRCH